MIPVPMDPEDANLCDAVVVTHEHIDHMHAPSYRPLVENLGAVVHPPGAAYSNPDYETDYDVPDGQCTVVEPGNRVNIGDLTIHVRAGNDPDAIKAVTYVVEHDAGTYFNSGDSRPARCYEEIGTEFDIDVESLTFGTVGRIHRQDEGETRRSRWYSDENQVIELANALEIDRLIPVVVCAITRHSHGNEYRPPGCRGQDGMPDRRSTPRRRVRTEMRRTSRPRSRAPRRTSRSSSRRCRCGTSTVFAR